MSINYKRNSMSIVSLINPSGNITAQDTLWHIAYSDNSGQIDMKYVFDVYTNGNQLIRAKVYPNPTNGRGYFDAHRIIQNEIKFDWFTPTANNSYLISPDNSGQSSLEYQIKVGEEVSGTTTLNMASGNIRVYNYIPKVFNRKVNRSEQNNWTTNRPFSASVGKNDKFLIGIRHNGTKIYLRTDAWNPTTNAYDITCIDLVGNQAPSDGGLVRKFTQLDIGFNSISNLVSQPCFNFNNNTYLDVKFYTNLTDVQAFRLYYDCDERYTHINLYFINAYGMFDTARFKLVNRLSMTTERKMYEKNDFRYNTTSVEYYNAKNVYNETKINFGSVSNWIYKLTMDYPTDAEYQWLWELIVSPQVYAEIEGMYYPVTIKNTNYDYNEVKWAGLKTLEIEIELNQQRYGFRR